MLLSSLVFVLGTLRARLDDVFRAIDQLEAAS